MAALLTSIPAVRTVTAIIDCHESQSGVVAERPRRGSGNERRKHLCDRFSLSDQENRLITSRQLIDPRVSIAGIETVQDADIVIRMRIETRQARAGQLRLAGIASAFSNDREIESISAGSKPMTATLRCRRCCRIIST